MTRPCWICVYLVRCLFLPEVVFTLGLNIEYKYIISYHDWFWAHLGRSSLQVCLHFYINSFWTMDVNSQNGGHLIYPFALFSFSFPLFGTSTQAAQNCTFCMHAMSSCRNMLSQVTTKLVWTNHITLCAVLQVMATTLDENHRALEHSRVKISQSKWPADLMWRRKLTPKELLPCGEAEQATTPNHYSNKETSSHRASPSHLSAFRWAKKCSKRGLYTCHNSCLTCKYYK